MRKRDELRRCDEEIAALERQNQADPEVRAHLAVLGREDWECEKRLIAGEGGAR